MKTIYLLSILFCLSFIAKAQWQIIPTNTSDDLVDISFANDSVGFIIGKSGTVLKTTDKGNSWNTMTILPNGYSCILAIDEDTVFAGGVELWRSDDGGVNWNYLSSFNDTITGICFFNANHGYILKRDISSCTSGSSGTVTRPISQAIVTVDFGITWQNFPLRVSRASRYRIKDNVAFISSYLVLPGSGGIGCAPGVVTDARSTSDFGNTWQVVSYHGLLNDLVNDSTLYYLDFNYTLNTFEIKSLTGGLISSVATTNLGNLYMRDFCYVDPDVGYIITDSLIWKSSAGYSTWTIDYTSSSGLLKKLYNLDSSVTFCLGNQGLLLGLGLTNVGIQELSSKCSISPNPSFDGFTINLFYKEQNISIAVFEQSGRKIPVSITQISASEYFVDKLNPGFYYAEIRRANHRSVVKIIQL